MKLGTVYGTGTINNSLTLSGRLYVTQERIDVSTSGPKADPLWTAVDSAGHFHARSGDGYPTLRSREIPVPCDGSCGGLCEGQGTSRTEWSCRICREVVEPGLIDGPHYGSIPGLYDWRMELEGFAVGGPPPGYEPVSVRFDAAGPDRPWLFFGVAVQTDTEISSGMGGGPLTVRMTLAANGELGDRPPMPVKAL